MRGYEKVDTSVKCLKTSQDSTHIGLEGRFARYIA